MNANSSLLPLFLAFLFVEKIPERTNIYIYIYIYRAILKPNLTLTIESMKKFHAIFFMVL